MISKNHYEFSTSQVISQNHFDFFFFFFFFFDIKKMSLRYKKLEFLISKKFYFVTTKSDLFLISQNRICDIKKWFCDITKSL